MAGGHAHSHAQQSGADASATTRIAVAFGITAVLLVAQIVGSIVTGSLALLVDTVHMLTDVAGLGVALVVVVEGVRRLAEPTDVPGPLLLVFGVVGLAGNLIALAVLAGGRGSSLNLRAAFLEVLNDAIGSVAVVAAAVAIWVWGFQQADLIASAIVAALIVPRSLVLLRDTGRILLEASPQRSTSTTSARTSSGRITCWACTTCTPRRSARARTS